MSLEQIQWIVLIAFGIIFIGWSPVSKTINEFFQAQTKNGKSPGVFLLTSSLVISWIFAKSITNAADLGLAYGIVGGVAYAQPYQGLYLYVPATDRAFLLSAEGNSAIAERSAAYDLAATAGEAPPVYRFDHNVLGADDVQLERHRLRMDGGRVEIDLDLPNPYADLV